MLLLGNDAAVLVLHEVLLLEATARVVGRAVPDLRVRADCALGTAEHIKLRRHGLASHHVLARTAATAHHLRHGVALASHRVLASHHALASHHLRHGVVLAAHHILPRAAATTAAHHFLTISIVSAVFHLYLYIRFFLQPAWGFFQTL